MADTSVDTLASSSKRVPFFGRVVTAMVTPFHDSGEVNYPLTEKLANHLVDHGTDTVLVCGTTGESPSLTWDEEYALFQTVKQAVGSRAKVLAGTGSNSTQEAIEATRKAEKLGLDGSLQVVPYYNKPPQEGLYGHFEAIAQAAPDLPIMLYNVPGRTSCNLLPETAIKLSKLPNIIAIKEASGNLDQVSQLSRLSSAEFEIYSGDDSLTLPMLSVGAVGVVSVASHLVGDALQEMVKAFESGQVSQAAAIHLKLFPLFKALFATTSPIPLKVALDLQGWAIGNCRLPLSSGSAELRRDLADTLTQMSLLQPIA
ncbi:dihydrodipicolinate synthase [Synechococcus sp. PCC 7335]|uniref:4-hydroxy-tetrahydrodipicolinate synthase n=1 Tax=Synechococcus sp. (strain ATCC 29403 / PCC 7335) TaxID=91464 RepID=UPI00017EE0CE|nr:4-hydroxy-tetrahydrodipicolinate synthase [Synechococcus sp. PCC 7335]EDX84744.1 dihydrodipicolinate synthase [Synechococcus sp. PCC 7335]